MEQEQNLKKLLDQFDENRENTVLAEKYLSETFFDVVGKAHSETVHSNFLKWFFMQYTWDALAIKNLIWLAKKRTESLSVFPKILSDIESLKKCTISGIDVKREVSCKVQTHKGKKNGRVDIVISCNLKLEETVTPLKIVIENKVDSTDHDHQTFVYYTYFSNKDSRCLEHGMEFKAYTKKWKYKPEHNNEIQLFLYLSPDWNRESNKSSCICNEFIKISYQDLYDKVLIDYKPVQSSANKRRQLFLEEYRKNLIKPYLDKNNNIRVMAYDENDIERIETFWHTNLSLFKLAAEVMRLKTTDAEKAERINSIIQGIDTLGNNYSLYDLHLPDGENHKGERMKAVAKRIVEYLLDRRITVSEINKLLPKEILIVDADYYKEKEWQSSDPRFAKRWDKLEGENLYLSNQWTAPRFASFTSTLANTHPEIKIEKAAPLSGDGGNIRYDN